MKLSKSQKQVLAEFFGNFAVAWLAVGLIGPFFQEKSVSEAIKSGVISIAWSGLLIWGMLFLTKGGRK